MPIAKEPISLHEAAASEARLKEQALEIARLKKINAALIDYVERSSGQHGNPYSLFQTAINLEGQVRRRTEELTETLASLESTNRELSEAKEQAEKANLSKTRFLAAASHDLLQPVNAAHLLMTTLVELQHSEESIALACRVQKSLNTIDDLLRALLDISRLDAGVMQTKIESVPVKDLFDSLASDFSPLASRRRISLKFLPTSCCVTSDRTMLRRILQNLISNAIRYTHTGGVLIASRKRADHIRIDVVDTGTGIAEELHEDIFEEFNRGLPPEAHMDDVGIGLGLSIVKRMTDTLAHPMTFRSVPGRGTWFQLLLPDADQSCEKRRQDPDHHSAGVSRIQGVHGARVLLIEKNFAVMQSTRQLLEKWHCSIETATDVNAVHRSTNQAHSEPDVIIAELEFDNQACGVTSIQILREKFGHDIPIIVAAANSNIDSSLLPSPERVMLTSKPIKPAQLRALLAHVLSN